jgi:hypothetical protein
MMSSHEQMTVHAADLAERIVDEISQSHQDWGAIERHTRMLLELVAARAEVPHAGRGADGARARAARTAELSVATS